MKPLEEARNLLVRRNLPYILYSILFIVFSLLLGAKGYNYTLKDGQIHVSTLLWLTLMACYFYEALPIKEILWRFIYSSLMTFWFFEVHDIFWFLAVPFLGVRIGLPTIHPPLIWYWSAAGKYVTFLSITTYWLRKYLKPNKTFKMLFIIQVLCHIVVTAYMALNGDLPWSFFTIQMLYDTLPYLFLVNRHG